MTFRIKDDYKVTMNEKASNMGETTPLEYARMNGLVLNYTCHSIPSDHFRELQKNVPFVPFDIRIFNQSVPTGSGVDLDVDRHITISRDTVTLLASIEKHCSLDEINSLVLPLLDDNNVRSMKLALPLLRSDNEMDCQNFARRDDFEIELEDIKLPLEVVDDGNNEGLIFPSRYIQLASDLIENLRKEKLMVLRKALQYLESTHKVTWDEADERSLWNQERNYQGVSPPVELLF